MPPPAVRITMVVDACPEEAASDARAGAGVAAAPAMLPRVDDGKVDGAGVDDGRVDGAGVDGARVDDVRVDDVRVDDVRVDGTGIEGAGAAGAASGSPSPSGAVRWRLADALVVPRAGGESFRLYPRIACPRGQSTLMRNVRDGSMIGSSVRS